MKQYIISKLSLVLLLISFNSYSQEWTGAVNSDWNNQLNWTDWPLNGEDITIDPINYTGVAASPVISSASVFDPGAVLVQNGAQLIINNDLTTSDRVEILGALTNVTINSGNVNAAGAGSSGRFIIAEGAMVTMNGGSLNCSQRLLIELGAHFTLNGGSINVSETLAIVDGDAVSSSTFIMNGGTVTVAIELAFENESGDYDPVFQMNNGALTVNGDVVWLGVAPGIGTPRLILKGGNTIINGSIMNDPLSTANLYLYISDSAIVNFNGPSIDLVFPGDSLVQMDNGKLKFNNTGVINNTGVFYSSSANTVFNGTTSLQGTGNYSFHSVEIQTGHSLIHINPVAINVKGNIIHNGIFTANSNLVRFTGDAQQSISGIPQLELHNVQVDNASGIIINRNTKVASVLDLTDGVVSTSNSGMMIISDNAIVMNASDSSYVNGPLKKNGNDAFVFPIGKVNGLHKLGMSAPTNVNAEFIAEYFNSAFSNTTSLNPPLVSVSQNEYWDLQRSNGTDLVQVKLFWEDASQSNLTDCSELTIASWNNTAWDSIASQVNGSCLGTDSGYVQSVMPVNPGVYTFGNTSISTAIDDGNTNASSSFNIYPNPVVSGNHISLERHNSIDQDFHVMISELTGKVVFEKNFEGDDHKTDIGLPAFNAGVYFIEIKSAGKRMIGKLIVQ